MRECRVKDLSFMEASCLSLRRILRFRSNPGDHCAWWGECGAIYLKAHWLQAIHLVQILGATILGVVRAGVFQQVKGWEGWREGETRIDWGQREREADGRFTCPLMKTLFTQGSLIYAYRTEPYMGEGGGEGRGEGETEEMVQRIRLPLYVSLTTLSPTFTSLPAL